MPRLEPQSCARMLPMWRPALVEQPPATEEERAFFMANKGMWHHVLRRVFRYVDREGLVEWAFPPVLYAARRWTADRGKSRASFAAFCLMREARSHLLHGLFFPPVAAGRGRRPEQPTLDPGAAVVAARPPDGDECPFDAEPALARLKPRHRLVVTRRLGLDGGEPETLEAVSRRIGVSKERTRVLEQEALSAVARMWGLSTSRLGSGGGPDAALRAMAEPSAITPNPAAPRSAE